MSPIDKKTIDEKLFKLQEAIKILDDLQVEAKEVFLKDVKIQGAVMFNLIIGIELIIDIGNHILTEVFQKPARTYRDVIVYLGELGVIQDDFAQENKAMADFRNKLIHDYDRVELGKVYEYSQKASDVFRDFAKYYIEFLEKN